MNDARNGNADGSPPDRRANRPAWFFFATACGIFLLAAIALMLTYGVPGTTGGTSESQQQTSGAPQPDNEMRDGTDRQTTGYGKGGLSEGGSGQDGSGQGGSVQGSGQGGPAQKSGQGGGQGGSGQ